MNQNNKIDISAIVTFHAEGLVAHRTLLGLERVRRYANQHNIVVEFVLVLDTADAETSRIVRSSPVLREIDQILEVSIADQGASRNSGIAVARGDYLGLFDGDDYYSENWLFAALETVRKKEGLVVVHPRYVVSFGEIHTIGRLLDLDVTPGYPLANLFSVHPWVCSSFARRSVYVNFPFLRSDSAKTGFGFEDWHWNLEVLAGGARHVSAPDTAIFYRRKPTSVLTMHLQHNVLVQPSRFFDASKQQEIAESDRAQSSPFPIGAEL